MTSTTTLFGIKMHPKVKFVIVALGIFISYFCFGILHEKVTRSTYGDFVNVDGTRGERFRYELTLVGIQCLCYCICARVSLSIKPDEKPDKTHYLYYVGASVAYLSAMVTSNMALRSLSYPMQVVGKSAKPIPVMIMVTLIGGRRYFLQSYLFVLLIVVGIIVFFLEKMRMETAEKDANHSVQNVDHSSFGFGEILLMVSLSMDGVLGALQERIRSAYAPTGRQMMLALNSWSTIILSIAVIVTLQISEFAQFVRNYPEAICYILIMCIVGCIGQTFIYTMVTSFGSLPCSIVTTSRKFFTVLFSVLFYLNPLTRLQWFATVLVFLALLADAFLGRIQLPCLRADNPVEAHEAEPKVDFESGKSTQGETQDEKLAEPEERGKMLELTEASDGTAAPLSSEKRVESAV